MEADVLQSFQRKIEKKMIFAANHGIPMYPYHMWINDEGGVAVRVVQGFNEIC